MDYCPTSHRSETLRRLLATLPGKNLHDLAMGYGITVRESGKLNKGWVGQTIERAALLETSNRQGPDGNDFELKTTSLVLRGGKWSPKETIKVTQLNPGAILEERFETSALWAKLARLVVVGCHHTSEAECIAVHMSEVDVTDPELHQSVRSFWEDIQQLVIAGEIADHLDVGRSDDFIQLRPTGTGRELTTCPITGRKFSARSFYATKRFIARVLHLEGKPIRA
jgi:DNA mismatch repair protein MutH